MQVRLLGAATARTAPAPSRGLMTRWTWFEMFTPWSRSAGRERADGNLEVCFTGIGVHPPQLRGGAGGRGLVRRAGLVVRQVGAVAHIPLVPGPEALTPRPCDRSDRETQYRTRIRRWAWPPAPSTSTTSRATAGSGIDSVKHRSAAASSPATRSCTPTGDPTITHEPTGTRYDASRSARAPAEPAPASTAPPPNRSSPRSKPRSTS